MILEGLKHIEFMLRMVVPLDKGIRGISRGYFLGETFADDNCVTIAMRYIANPMALIQVSPYIV